MLEKSENLKNLAAALVKFQKDVENVKKDSKNPFFKSKYASLSNVIDAIREPLSNNELAFMQFPSGDGELITVVIHSSGEYIMASFKMSPTKNDPQALGSAITYARRYGLAAALGLNVQDDDDGNAASDGSHPMAGKSTGYPYTPPVTKNY